VRTHQGALGTVEDLRTKESAPGRVQRRRGGESRYWLVQAYPPSPDGYPAACVEVVESLVVGREPALDGRLLVRDQAMSRTHTVLYRKEDQLHLQDQKSTNGTFLNGDKVGSARILHQDVLRCGDTLFVVAEGEPQPRPDLRKKDIVVCSEPIARAFKRAEEVSHRRSTLLIVGETGTGKDVLAGHVHFLSRRRGKFVAVNCAAIQEGLAEALLFGSKKGAFTGAEDSEGIFSAANSGTLFLDEIGELSPTSQAKLLRFLETHEITPVGATGPVAVDVRIIAATNRADGSGSIGGTLREDVRGRLEDDVVLLPPLRSRKEEIVPLVWHTLKQESKAPEELLGADFVQELLLYSWPRNVRQLVKAVRNCVSHLGPDGRQFELSLLDELLVAPASAATDGPAAGVSWDKAPTRDELIELLDAARHNISEVARRVGCHRMQIHRWMKRYDIKSPW